VKEARRHDAADGGGGHLRGNYPQNGKNDDPRKQGEAPREKGKPDDDDIPRRLAGSEVPESVKESRRNNEGNMPMVIFRLPRP